MTLDELSAAVLDLRRRVALLEGPLPFSTPAEPRPTVRDALIAVALNRGFITAITALASSLATWLATR